MEEVSLVQGRALYADTLEGLHCAGLGGAVLGFGCGRGKQAEHHHDGGRAGATGAGGGG